VPEINKIKANAQSIFHWILVIGNWIFFVAGFVVHHAAAKVEKYAISNAQCPNLNFLIEYGLVRIGYWKLISCQITFYTF